MPDYIYLLANRLSPSQQSALQSIREIAREAGMTVFLTGGAVRDLTSGSPVRDLDVSVQGNALDLKAKLIEVGALLWGEHVPSQTLFARFPGSVRVEVSSTRREEFPKPGKPEYHPGSILEDLRRRDFTANAMALSLNEGSYGLLMDPLNGVADLEARVLRLVSNYGFLEDPIRMVRAVRLQARLGWELEEKTKVRFENAREEGLIEQVPAFQQGYEVEEIVHEEDGFKILKALEADGWMKFLFPAWTSAKVDTEALDSLREVLVQLQMQGVNPDPSAAQAQLLTAKLPSKDLAALKKLFVRQGFVHEWETQEERAKEVGKRLIGKEASMPSAAWKLLTSSDPEAVLWLALTSKSAPIQARLKEFFTVWPEARQRIPYALMQEMRITPELEGYQDLLKSIFFELIDGKLTSDEEIRQFLEPHSPPAPPPPVSIRRTRSKKSAEKNREVRDMDEDEIGDARPERDEDSEDEEEIDEESDAGDGRSELVVRPMLQIVPPPPPVIPSAAKPAPELSVVPVALEEQHPEAPRTGAKPKLKSVGELAILATRSAVKSDAAEPSNEPNKSASNRTPAKPIAKTAAKPTARSTAKPTVKPVLVKSALKPAVKAAKPIAKPAEKPKPALKKAAVKSAVVKKASVKTGAKGKLPAKAKPAQAILKAKPIPSRSAPAKKSSVATKVSAKSAPAKKRR